MNNLIGAPKESLDTPVLLVDLDILQRNIDRMAKTIVHEAGVGWRPHTKAMKTPALAHMCLAAGAHGVTCAKLGEAEIMAAAGIRDILVANQIVGPAKVDRLANLSMTAHASASATFCGSIRHTKFAHPYGERSGELE